MFICLAGPVSTIEAAAVQSNSSIESADCCPFCSQQSGCCQCSHFSTECRTFSFQQSWVGQYCYVSTYCCTFSSQQSCFCKRRVFHAIISTGFRNFTVTAGTDLFVGYQCATAAGPLHQLSFTTTSAPSSWPGATPMMMLAYVFELIYTLPSFLVILFTFSSNDICFMILSTFSKPTSM